MNRFNSLLRRDVLLGAAGLGATLLAGCNSTNPAATITADDMTLGSPTAPVTLIEYASVLCPHCREFHDTMWEQLKHDYIDSGKVRFVLREYPTGGPPALVIAGFQVARCGNATPQQYFTRVDVLYGQQAAIEGAGSMDGVRQKLVEIGQSAGLTEQQVMACINDDAGGQRMQRFETGGDKLQVTGTPMLYLNGVKIDPTPATYDALKHTLDAALAGH